MPEAWTAGDPLGFALAVGFGIGLLLAAVSWRPEWVTRNPWPVLIAAIGVSLAAAMALVDPVAGSLRLEIDASTEPLLPSGDPSQEEYRRATADFGDDEVFVIVTACDEVFSASCLGAMKAVSDRIAHLDGVRSVRSLLDVTSFRYVPEEDWVEVRPFIEEVPEDPAELAGLREWALNDPVYRRSLVSADSRAAALNVSFREMSDAEFIAADLDGRIAAILAEHSDGVAGFHVAGRPHVKTRVYHGLLGDLRALIPLSVIVVGMVLWIVTRTRRGVALPLGTALVANLWTFAAIAFLDRSLTLLTGLLGPTLLAIGSVYGVHVLARYEEEAEACRDARGAALASLRHLRLPVGIAGLTTLVGFAALLITDVPAVFELGAFSMLGVASITLLSLTVLPALLSVLPVRPRARHGIDRRLDASLVRVAAFVRRRTGAILVASALVVVASIVAIPRIVIDTDYLAYLDEDDPVRVDFDAVNRLLTGAVPLYVLLEGEEHGIFREPEVLRAVQDLQARLDAVPGVSRTLTFIDSLRVLNRAFHAGDPGEERVPDSRAGVSELLFMIPKPDLQRFLTVNHARANLVVRTGEVGSAAIRRLTGALEAAIDDWAVPTGLRASVTGNAILLSHSADGIARRQPWSVGIAALAIFALISWGLGSARLGAIAMVPNIVPVMLFFGVLGMGVAPLSLPTSLIGCLALGIAVDDTAHFLVRYRQERSDGASPEDAAARCGVAVGRPIAITSWMLFLGFLVVAFSDFATLREFGVLSAVTMAFCLVTDIVLLPALLIRSRV